MIGNDVVLTKKQFDELLEYSCSLPTGTTIGKQWKKGVPYNNPKTWYLCEYVKHEGESKVGITYKKITAVFKKQERIMDKKTFLEFIQWQQDTFPNQTALEKLNHLDEEIKELKQSIVEKFDLKEIKFEFADCFLLLIAAASKQGLSFEDIHESIKDKFEIIKLRNWDLPDKNGVYHHIKD